MSYEYIERAYGVTVTVGQRISMDGRIGTVLKPRSNEHYLCVQFDGWKSWSYVHPTWKMDYAPVESKEV